MVYYQYLYNKSMLNVFLKSSELF